MDTSRLGIVSSFIEAAPPGELDDVVADIRSLSGRERGLVESAEPTFKRYNEEQLATTKLPGASQEVIISAYNALEDGRYYDSESQTSFAYHHVYRQASAPASYVLDSQHVDLVRSLLKALAAHAQEHYPNAAYGVYPIENDSSIAIVLVSNKYSPSNFWNGRWRVVFHYSPSENSLSGTIKVDIHYYEDGNVRLLSTKPISTNLSSTSASSIIKSIAVAEKKYQDELNLAFSNMSEGVFKSLRRQLPVTRQKIEWEKISSYRVGQDIGGGRGR